MEANGIPKRILYTNLESTRPRNRWQDEVMEDGRIVGAEEWQEKVYNRGMEEAPENGKELLHSAHANGINCAFIHIVLSVSLVHVKVRDSEVLACVWGQWKMSKVLGAFVLLDFTMLQPILTWCTF
jgi:hypothetical protein